MDVPKCLYKYKGFDPNGYWERLLKHQEIFFASPNMFNDPFECKARFDYEASKADKISRYAFQLWVSFGEQGDPRNYIGLARNMIDGGHVGNEAHRKEVEELMHKKQNDIFAILSLSENPDNVLMWSHYADNHTGFCVEFDTSCGRLFRGARKVQYHKHFPVLNWWKDSVFNIYWSMVFNKSDDWSYEKEWRVFDESGKGVRKFRAKALSGIYMGCQISEENAYKLVSLAKSFPFDIKVYSSKIKEREYSLDFSEVDKKAFL
ncbi:DUF2971 domain-containing protein [Halomonas elongata]|uniref:DUF2971 domain-containing protein n=1 Tax=Halomonas elongata TaxID=2746 RepID=UPI00186B99D6|nr:DUF2971 domain-containing protein [Halomonas elongata]MBW5798624.1 DUF2971 domain-containing protein [Halomonas elongata]